MSINGDGRLAVDETIKLFVALGIPNGHDVLFLAHKFIRVVTVSCLSISIVDEKRGTSTEISEKRDLYSRSLPCFYRRTLSLDIDS